MAAHAPSSSSAAAVLSFTLSFLFGPCPSLPPPLAQQSALKWPHLLQLLHCFLDLGLSVVKASSFILDCCFLILHCMDSSMIMATRMSAVRGCPVRRVAWLIDVQDWLYELRREVRRMSV